MLKTKFYDDRQRDGRRDLLSKLKLWKFPIDGLFVLVASDSSFRHGNQSKTINLLRRQRMAEAGRMTGHSVLFKKRKKKSFFSSDMVSVMMDRLLRCPGPFQLDQVIQPFHLKFLYCKIDDDGYPFSLDRTGCYARKSCRLNDDFYNSFLLSLLCDVDS